MHTAMRAPARRFGLAATARCGAAAIGAAAGALVAFPVGGLLATWLFTNVGKRIVTSVVVGGTDDVHGIAAVFAAILLVIAGVAIAAIVVVALVAPVFVLLPMLASGVALRLTGAGLVLRSLWLMLAAVVLLSGFTLAVLGAVHAQDGVRWWMWPAVVCVGAFAGRALVELVWPATSGTPARRLSVARRWKVLGAVWLILVVAVLAALAVVYVGLQTHVH